MALTDTREHRIAPVRDKLFTLIDERVGGARAAVVRAFGHAYLRRLASDGADEPAVEDLFGEVTGLFAFADARGTEPIAVRALNPTRERDRYKAAGTVVETNSEDWPFLVDSVLAELHAQGLRVQRVLHPILGVERDKEGRIGAVLHPREASTRESVMHFDLDRRLADEQLPALEAAVRGVLEQVCKVVRDFAPMVDRARRMGHLAAAGAVAYPDDEVDETVAFLEWLLQDHFIFLGYREYRITEETISVVNGSGLGLLADDATSSFAHSVMLDALSPDVRDLVRQGELLIVSKTNRLSAVHKRVRMDYVGVRRVTADGRTVGEARMLGLFTTKAYAEPASETPLLHRKLRQILRREDLIEGSHDYKAAVSLFDAFPKDELFIAPTDDLRRAVVTLLSLQGNQIRVMGRYARDGRSASLIVALPKERYDPDLLERLRRLFAERFETDAVDTQTVMGEENPVQIHFAVHAAAGLPELSFRDLEHEVVTLARTWDDRLRELLDERLGVGAGRALAARWAPRFPAYYKASVDPSLALHDVECFERLERGAEPFVVGLQNQRGGPTRVGLYKAGGKVELSEVMPTLEHLGLRVIEEVPTRLLGGDEDTWVQDFGVLGPDDRPLDLDLVGTRVADAIAAVRRGSAESDLLNRLVVVAGLDWRQVNVLRAYRKYRQRIGSRFTERYQNDVLAANPTVTAKLVRYFELRFDPLRPRDEAAEQALRTEILADLDEVSSLDHDRILRNQLGLIHATLRTNAFSAKRDLIAFKISSPDVPAMPQPPPLREIYLYSPEMEGIHLRGGAVARGGIRWSERMDYRTEVYGLMRAQLTKNAVIVPAGAKGGFYLRRAPADPAALKAEVERQYVRYVNGLLELTDNLVDGEVVHPEGLRVLDGPDTYLVVAADKGTATFSDIANRVAEERGFWLGDAFASGGSSGYDHKALGITARGAWESVKRHFRELDLDPAVDEFTAVGIGDMSGDVFGNGMLLSDRIRLVAAYDHRHVFVDPDPDAAASFEERRRLFALPASSWDDYDRTKISPGGGVWPRSAKSIALPEPARAALGIEAEALAPTELIRAILRAPVDLLWNGGIGTFVKASTESHDDAQDRASDAIRVDAEELRARVVGEGGNLGFTRLARIEYARAGGRINADFIDNSAGVDCSDHEVNLKILLGLAERAGELTRPERDELLRAITHDVVAHVLYDSFEQAQIIAQEVEVSGDRLYAYEDLMARLEEDGLLDRAAEDLPSADEMGERRRTQRGLERPELALLLAYAKRSVRAELLESPLPDDPWLARDLRGYFPAPVVERFGHHLAQHPLRRELIATINANVIVNALGPTFVSQLQAELGVQVSDVVRAFRVAREVTGAATQWEAIEQLGRGVERAVVTELMTGVDELVERVTRWYLAHRPGVDMSSTIAAGHEGYERLVPALDRVGDESWRERRAEAAARLAERGAPEALAHAHARRRELAQAPDVIAAAEDSRRSVEDVVHAFHLLGQQLRLDWLRGQLDGLAPTTRTQRWALHAVRDDAWATWSALVRAALGESPAAPVEEAVEAFVERRAVKVRRLGGVVRSLTVDGTSDLPALMLAVRHLRNLA